MKDDFQFGQFMPDAPDYNNPGLVICDNVFAENIAYKPIRSPVSIGISITGQVRGAWRVDIAETDSVMIVGTETDLYVLRSGVFIPSGLGLSLALDETWSFDQLGRSVTRHVEQAGFSGLKT